MGLQLSHHFCAVSVGSVERSRNVHNVGWLSTVTETVKLSTGPHTRQIAGQPQESCPNANLNDSFHIFNC
jgi:hypothetical protein